MRTPTLVVMLLLATLGAGARGAHAQIVSGFAGVSLASEMNGQHFPALGGGVVVDLPGSWLSAGAQGETLVSWPYFGGRGALFGQVRIGGRRTIAPLALAGYGFGEAAGPMFGGGVELRSPAARFGLRATVEDYVARVNGFDFNENGVRLYSAHQLSLRIAFLF